MTTINRFFIVLLMFEMVRCQTVILLEYKQNDSTTMCTKGLVNGIDELFFKCKATYSQQQSKRQARFLTKNNSDDSFKLLKNYNINTDCNGEMPSCKKITNDVVEIKVSMKAMTQYSGAQIKCETSSAEETISESTVQVFPLIEDSKSAKGNLRINGKEIYFDGNEGYAHITSSLVSLEFMCNSSLVPCVIDVLEDDSKQVVKGINRVIYEREFKEPHELHFQIKYASCRLDTGYNSLSCKLKIEPPILQEKDESIFLSLTLLLTAATLIIIILILLKLRCSLKKYFNQILTWIFKYRSTNDPDSDDATPLYSAIKYHVLNTGVSSEESESCMHNQIPADFKAISELQLTDLPVGYQDKDLFKLIKTIADLTVMVSVKDRGNTMSNFTGFVGNVVKYETKDQKPCPCNKCDLRNPHPMKWGKIFVYTSTCPALINCNAKSIQCQLSFQTPTEVIKTIYGYEIGESDIKTSKCKLKCVTCDVKLLDKLIGIKQRLLNINAKINEKFKYPKANLQLSKDERRITIIVSHIHGPEKYVSFGLWMKRKVMHEMNGNIELTKYIYNAKTLPGCAGAYVYILGRDHGGWLFQHHHIGIDKDGLGHSGHGIDLV
ncbi:unnamed protein product [Lymnaea stagnalis]|uniref:Uncharacterized protein n=1 Tax=Lymnaea stagnalis TaxID=6523 RepID=A0AAV2HHQ2_LYMST